MPNTNEIELFPNTTHFHQAFPKKTILGITNPILVCHEGRSEGSIGDRSIYILTIPIHEFLTNNRAEANILEFDLKLVS